jgi:hypothetical protein
LADRTLTIESAHIPGGINAAPGFALGARWDCHD